MTTLYYSLFRLKDEILCVKIYANGEKFDIGGGKQFKSISDLILHYKKYPLKTIKGIDIYLDQVNYSYTTVLPITFIYRELTLTVLQNTAQVAMVKYLSRIYSCRI